jgi:hypothetical protein
LYKVVAPHTVFIRRGTDIYLPYYASDIDIDIDITKHPIAEQGRQQGTTKATKILTPLPRRQYVNNNVVLLAKAAPFLSEGWT